MLQSKVKTALTRLQKLYYNNLISYPRVEISYATHPQAMLSHKPLAIISSEFEPFCVKRKEINFNSSLLFLHTKRLITPAMTPTISSYVDDFFDEELNLKKAVELNRLIQAKNEFLNSQEVKNSSFVLDDDFNFFAPKYFEIYKSEPSKKLQKVDLPILFGLAKKTKPKEELAEHEEVKIMDGISFKNLSDFRNYVIKKNERLLHETHFKNDSADDFGIKL